jgi:hypothetical protein
VTCTHTSRLLCCAQARALQKNTTRVQAHLHGLFKDDARIANVAVALVKLGKRDPQRVGLAERLVVVHGLHGLRVRQDLRRRASEV